MWDVPQYVTLEIILQKYVSDHNFWTNPQRMMILVYVFMVKDLMAPFILPNDLDFSRLWLLQSHIWCHILVTTGQNMANF